MKNAARFAVVSVVSAISIGMAHAGATIYISSSDVAVPSGYTGAKWNACPLDYVDNGKNNGIISPHAFKQLVDSTGAATDVSMFLMSPANGHHKRDVGELTGDAEEFEGIKNATSSCATFHIAPETSTGAKEPEIRARFTGLDPDKLYEFSFMAFATGTTDLTEKYTVIGATTVTREFNPAGNTTQVVRIPAIAPTPDGSVEFTLAAAEGNEHVNKAAYLSAVKIEEMDSFSGQDIYVDAYDAGTENRTTSGISWNAAKLYASGVTMSSLVDSNGNATSVSLVSTQGKTNTTGNNFWQARVGTLTGDAAVFAEAISDGASGSGQYQACLRVATDVFRATVSGLYPECTYTFTFFATYGGTAETVKKVTYSVSGATSGSSILDTDGNTSNVATISGIRPNEDGTVEISYCNTSGGVYSYLAAFRISRAAVASAGTKPVFVKATSGGSVSATVDGEASSCERYLASDKTLVATATPDAGYKFAGWTSSWTNATETSNPMSIAATRAVTWTAVFEKDDAYVSKTMYVDANGTPGSDGKTWNAFGDGIFGLGEWQGPFLASDGTSAAIGFKTICPFGRKISGGNKPVNSNAKLTLTGDAAEFNAARAVNNDQLYMHVGLNSYTNRAIVAFDVCGLKTGRVYKFNFVSSWTGGGSNEPEDLFVRCVGENTVSASLDPKENTSNVATVANVRPGEDGMVRVQISTAPQNTYSRKGLTYLTAFSIEGDISETDAKHILWFGNSFANYGDIPARVADLAELAGFTRPVIVKSLKNSSILSYHVDTVTNTPENNVCAPEIMYQTSRNWDDVIIQGRMLEAAAKTAEANGYPDPSVGFIPLATNLYSLVRKSAKGEGVRAVLYQTWPYAAEATSVYPSLYATPSAMLKEIAGNYETVRALINAEWGSKSAVTAPVGVGYEKARFDADFYYKDYYHQGGKYGFEFVAMILFNRIYDTTVEKAVPYAKAYAAGWTSLEESEYTRLVKLATRADMSGLCIIFR